MPKGIPAAGRPDPIKRFWAKVDKRGPKMLHMRSRCHVWQGRPADKKGYGTFTVGGVTKRVNRYALELKLGRPIKHGFMSLHRCDNDSCVWFEHLYEGTQAENVADAVKRGRLLNRQPPPVACVHGHKYTAENTGLYRNKRYCKTCDRIKAKARYHAKKAAA